MYIELKSDDVSQITRLLGDVLAQSQPMRIAFGKEGGFFTLSASVGEEEEEATSS